MTFSYSIKTELCDFARRDITNQKACLYGMLMFSRQFSITNISLHTEHEGVATLFVDFINVTFDAGMGIRFSSTTKKNGGTLHSVTIDDEDDRRAILSYFGQADGTINIDIVSGNDECVSAFLRGAFLVSGSATDPSKEYHFEINAPSQAICDDMVKLINEQGMAVKGAVRKEMPFLYIKGSEKIEDILTFMGATKSSLKLMNIKIYKDVRNRVNRTTNCETANIDKIVTASVRQVADIEYIIERNSMGLLDDELVEIAQLRLENPDLSLRELGQALSTPISRSSVNHRLTKISKIASDLRTRMG
ncbi:MAG: DNA-binding protein WhiA [Clostridiales bacterium]|nr:DNA-binding protein WhiA [Clostridiales bacterium]